jgi:hypothetical protein
MRPSTAAPNVRMSSVSAGHGVVVGLPRLAPGTSSLSGVFGVMRSSCKSARRPACQWDGSDPSCPLDTDRARAMWQASGTAGKDERGSDLSASVTGLRPGQGRSWATICVVARAAGPRQALWTLSRVHPIGVMPPRACWGVLKAGGCGGVPGARWGRDSLEGVTRFGGDPTAHRGWLGEGGMREGGAIGRLTAQARSRGWAAVGGGQQPQELVPVLGR